jgi:hypothetical protein
MTRTEILTSGDAKHLDQMWATFDEFWDYLFEKFPESKPIHQHLLAIEMHVKGVAFQLCSHPAERTN